MTTTHAAVALDALVAALVVALPEGRVVIDGQPRERINDPDVVVIGFSPDGPAVKIAQQDADMGGGRTEVLSVACTASSERGERDPQAVPDARRSAVETLDLIEAALDVDPTLGGVVTEARFGMAGALDQRRSKGGTEANIDFTILVEIL